ncbi:MAG: recombinase family protein [Candidatus Omnitrophica bacterium]|nr:recombinase family protein [Candidatus Omnitrophota bacterium]
MKQEPEKPKHLVCAIYTRKSTAEGPEKEFTSLDAQREAAENYIRSQQHEGWTALPDHYDDGGFTGANTERPALQALINDIKAGRINCVIVYKVDRLSRSLLDFSQLLEFFEKHGVTFVSVTQQFNTNSSMGRLTLNILLSFAQFEREIISERTKDKMGAARKRGQWLGGRPPFGYYKENKKLVIAPNEAEIVRKIFTLYLKTKSILKVVQILNDEGLRTRQWTKNSIAVYGGKKYGVSQLQHMLNNVLYIGKVKFDGQIYDGQQPAIIDEEIFKQAQSLLAVNRAERKPFKNMDCFGLLSQLLKCKHCVAALFHSYTMKGSGKKYRYYVCSSAQKRSYKTCPNRSLPAHIIETAVVEKLREILPVHIKTNTPATEAFLSPVWETLFNEAKRRVLKEIVREIECDTVNHRLTFNLHNSPEKIETSSDIRRAALGRRWRKETAVQAEPSIRQALILAHNIDRLIKAGTIQNTRQAADWLGLSISQIGHNLGLLLLAPAIQNEILTGKDELIETISEYKVRLISFETDWFKQMELWQEIKGFTQEASLSLLTE